MRIAIVTEFSVSSKNAVLLDVLTSLGHNAFAIGMTDPNHIPTLNYIQTGLTAALALNLGIADFVVGGCGTGQGFEISVMQYPGVYCGLLKDVLDAWLFKRINGGNCVSLPLNQGFGWAADQGLRMMFTELFRESTDKAYPLERTELQKSLRSALRDVSGITHRPMEEILKNLNPSVTKAVFSNTEFTRHLKKAPPSALQTMVQSMFLNVNNNRQ